MSAAEQLSGTTLKGLKGDKSWKVLEKLENTAEASLGQNSFAYFAVGEDGEKVFLKASDLGMFTRFGADNLQAMALALNGHMFERQMLDHCSGNNMDRVVTALDYGEHDLSHHGTRDKIFFLVFERAEGDLRRHVQKSTALNLVWSVTTLHNIFVAVSQLHGAYVAHNDIKPANALVFSKDVQKIADLGRATSRLFPAMHDGTQCAGDRRYAPPEQLYPEDLNCTHLDRDTRRVVGDLYNLGSLTHYLLSGRNLTSEVIPTLRPENRPLNKSGGSRDSYQAALPYWQAALAELVERLKMDVRRMFGVGVRDETERLIRIIEELGEPDPLRRGHPKNRGAGQSQYGLQRYVAELDMIRRRLMVKSA